MISVNQLRDKASRKYWSVLKALLNGETMFPLNIRADKTLPESFAAMHRAMEELVRHSLEKTGSGYRLSFAERKTRKHGMQSVPVRITFDSLSHYLTFTGKNEEAAHILRRSEKLCSDIPQLTDWVRENPGKTAKYLHHWEEITRVLLYFRDAPRRWLYIRELPIDVQTKFIENHTAILQELLEILIPEQINRYGVTFEERFHLKSPEPMVRLRRLDQSLHHLLFTVNDDPALPADEFNRLDINCRYVVITENRMTYLTLPSMNDTIAIYGGGFGVEILKNAQWLRQKAVIYWGDIDAHGFIILSRVRQFFPSTISIMMDEATFRQFSGLCRAGAGCIKTDGTHLRLTDGEAKFFRRVAINNLRLEQEHISQDYISAQFKNLLEKNPS